MSTSPEPTRRYKASELADLIATLTAIQGLTAILDRFKLDEDRDPIFEVRSLLEDSLIEELKAFKKDKPSQSTQSKYPL